MKTKKYLLVSFPLIAILLSSCVTTAPKCSVESLLLEESLFPDGTYFQPLVSPIPEYPDESFSQGFSLEITDQNYSVNAGDYSVALWELHKLAQEEFDDALATAFITDDVRGPWENPKEVTFSSTIADNYYTACATSLGYYQCRMTAVYGKYSVYFRADISEQGITYATYNRLLQAIDGKVAMCTE